MPLLELVEVTKRFGRLQALDRVSATVAAGQIHGVIGPNGAGKTTLIDILTGYTPATSGRILLDGRALDRVPVHRRVGLGIGRTFQTPQLCARMSVLDNIAIGAHRRLASASFTSLLPGRTRATVGELREEAARVADDVGLGALTGAPAGALSYGHMRLLEIGRALMAAPRLLVLDEPVAGMNETESGAVADLLRRKRDDGLTVLLVEHDMSFVMGLCDRISVLDHGVRLADGTPEEVTRDARVQEAYLGAAV